jgi:RNA polymerase sigma factor (TIGR02999 family)
MAVGEITQLLDRWTQGDPNAFDQLLPLVYDHLRHLARSYMRRERADHTLQSTALVHELILKLMEETRPDWKNRGQFYAVAASLMRRVLVDHARSTLAAKRGGSAEVIPLLPGLDVPLETQQEILIVDDALARFAALDAEGARIVEMRYFWGMTITEVADSLGISRDKVKRSWTGARMWLHRECSAALPD